VAPLSTSTPRSTTPSFKKMSESAYAEPEEHLVLIHDSVPWHVRVLDHLPEGWIAIDLGGAERRGEYVAYRVRLARVDYGAP